MVAFNQNQHKIPRVYLRKFGYLTPNNQWKVSVLKRGEKFTRQKSVDSFASATNYFDINSHDPRIHRLLENLNGHLETKYNSIVSELKQDGKISLESHSYLVILIANLIVRSDEWRNDILSLLESEVRNNFLQVILGHHSKDEMEFVNMQQQDSFKWLAEMSSSDAINRVLVYFLDHLYLRLQHFEVTFIRAKDGKPWITTSNPVVVHNRTGRLEIMAGESELYFPLTPEFLVYLHYPGSSDKENILRTYPSNIISLATEEQSEALQRIILTQDFEYMIFPELVKIHYQER